MGKAPPVAYLVSVVDSVVVRAEMESASPRRHTLQVAAFKLWHVSRGRSVERQTAQWHMYLLSDKWYKPTQVIQFMNALLFILSGLAFVPAVFLVARYVDRGMRPPSRRPWVFFMCGVFFGVLGLFCAYQVVQGADSGGVDCALKGCKASYEWSTQPGAYWLNIFAWYSYAVMMCALALAAFNRLGQE